MAWNFHAIEQMQLRRKYRVDGVGRPKFDFHTDKDGTGVVVAQMMVALGGIELRSFQ